jgi:hypothetical protein
LADTHAHHLTLAWGSHCHWGIHSHFSLYLHSFLGENTMEAVQRTKAQLTIVTGFALLSVIFHTKFLLLTAIVVGLMSLIFPPGGDIIVRIWTKLSELLGWANSKLILSLVYFVILLPVSLLYRLSHNNSLQLAKVEEGTYFFPRDGKYTARDFEKPW